MVHVEVVVAVVSVVVSRDVPLVASGGAVVSGVAVGGGTATADSVVQTGTAAAVETGGADSDTVSRTAVLTSGAIACVRGSAASLPRRHLLNSQRAETAGTEHGKQTGKSKHTRPPDKIRFIGGVVQAYANQQHGYAETLSNLWILI